MANKNNDVRSHNEMIVAHHKLRCLYTNLDGLNSLKGGELSIMLNQVKPHIVFLSETKMNSEHNVAQFVDCSEYIVIRKDRGSGHGGGVMMLVRNGISIEELNDKVWDDTESVVCEIKIGHHTVKVACIYRPPSAESDYNEKVRNTIQSLGSSTHGQVLICGDFNFPQIDWTSNTVQGGETTEQSKFLDACQDAFLHQHVEHFTRVRGGDRPSLLDLILTKAFPGN